MSSTHKDRLELPETLQNLPRVENFSSYRHRWNTNEEIASILICFDKHESWLSKEVKIRPQSGTMLLYSRKRVRYRRDGYCWKKRKDGKTTREDHMKLKVQGVECIYGCYVHSAVLPTFHRRCYWLLENPDIVLVHYLNVPSADESKMVTSAALSQCAESKKWTKEELVSQLKPMFHTSEDSDHFDTVTDTTVEGIVQQLMEKHQLETVLNSQQRSSRDRNISLKLAICPVTGKEKRSVQNNQAVIPRSTSGNVTSDRSTSKLAAQEDVPKFQPKVQKMGVITSRSGRPSSLKITSSYRSAQEKTTVATSTSSHFVNTSPTSVILSLSQIQGGGGLLILNNTGAVTGLGLTPTMDITTPITGIDISPIHKTTTAITTLGTTTTPDTTTDLTELELTPSSNNEAVVTCLEFTSVQNTTTDITGLDITPTQNTTAATELARSPALSTTTVQSILKLTPAQRTTAASGERLVQSHSSTTVSELGLRTTNILTNFGQNSNTTVQRTPLKTEQKSKTAFLGLQLGSKRSSEDNRTSKQHANNISIPARFRNELPGRESFLNIVSPKLTTNSIGLDSQDFLSSIAFFASSSEAHPTGTVHHRGDQTVSSGKVASNRRKSKHESQNLFLSSQESSAETFPKEMDIQTISDVNSFDVTPMDISDSDLPINHIDDVFQYNSLHTLTDFNTLVSPNSKHSPGNESSIVTTASSSFPAFSCSSQMELPQHKHDDVVSINDYSPDWSYTEGGIKVLISGPWDSSSSLYTALFDGVNVPTTLVQSGVLRCFCPAHDAAVVNLQVACEGRVISNSVTFEYYKRIISTLTTDNFNVDEQVLELSLMERLKGMESRLSIQSEVLTLCSDLSTAATSTSDHLYADEPPGSDQKKISTRTV
ncbi:calmodulin-binding transcription activator 1-like [Tachypleus tridentatus]|uniref:calmodulin-binding transcription activator 1-like n=1 Tax=Tachypleus tridentatus TaxID=6853 RepID=UPI003FD535F0